jgi:hypothetical protein
LICVRESGIQKKVGQHLEMSINSNSALEKKYKKPHVGRQEINSQPAERSNNNEFEFPRDYIYSVNSPLQIFNCHQFHQLTLDEKIQSTSIMSSHRTWRQ